MSCILIVQAQAEYGTAPEAKASKKVYVPVAVAPTLVFRSEYGMKIPCINASQWKDFMAIPDPSALIVVENAARTVAQAIFSILGLSLKNSFAEFTKNHSNIKVVILAGTGRKGLIGWAVARHLANHNLNVYLCRSR
jgi:hypothetical protein